MTYALKNVTVCDKKSPFHFKKVDIVISGKLIEKIEKAGVYKGKGYDLSNVIVTPGFVDLFANLNDPGNEHKEDLASGLDCALAGGFTGICTAPNTFPVIDSKGSVEYVKSKSENHAVSLLPIGALSVGLNGENLAEMLDLNSAGAIAFSDGLKPTQNAELLLKALQYSQKFNGLVINRPSNTDLSRFGQMNEGKVSTELGFKGIPNLAEEVMVERDISILRYSGGRLHFSCISTAGSVELIKRAKKDGLNVTCDIPLYSLLFTEEDVLGFDSNYKVNPPLRTKVEQKALLEGLKSGVIDAICTDHQPQDSESKNLEFDLADFGMIGIQTAFPSILSLKKKIDLEILVEKFTHGPRKVLGLDNMVITEGASANLSIFDESRSWTYNEKTNNSKSSNSPLLGSSLKGMCIGVINGTKSFFHSDLRLK